MDKRGTILLIGFVSATSIAQGITRASNADAPVLQRERLEAPTASVRVLAKAKAHPVGLDLDIQSSSRPSPSPRSPVPLLPILDQPDILPEDKQLLNAIMQWLPIQRYDHLRHIVVRYDSAAERGQATSSTILLRGDLPRKEKIAVFIHELGHTIDLGALKGNQTSGESSYPDGSIATYNDDPSVGFYAISWEDSVTRRVDARGEDFVSGYAKAQDVFEDMAESIVYYALHHHAFRERAKANDALSKKLAWLETHIFNVGFGATASEPWDGEIVWDVTKLKHDLHL